MRRRERSHRRLRKGFDGGSAGHDLPGAGEGRPVSGHADAPQNDLAQPARFLLLNDPETQALALFNMSALVIFGGPLFLQRPITIVSRRILARLRNATRGTCPAISARHPHASAPRLRRGALVCGAVSWGGAGAGHAGPHGRAVAVAVR